MRRLTDARPWQFFRVLPKADPMLATVWWLLLILRAALPSVFAIATGLLVGAVTAGTSLVAPLVVLSVSFVALQILPQLHTAVSMNLGSRVAARLNDWLAEACAAPPGIGHLEDPELASDLTTARDFDLGMSAPPMYLNVDFIAGSLTQLVSGLIAGAVLLRYSWWAPIVLVIAWTGTHWFLKESGVWKDRNTTAVKLARRHADYAFGLAVEPGPAKEVRLFGLPDWAVEKFAGQRRALFDLQYAATRLRERSIIGALVIVLAANAGVFWWLGERALSGAMPLQQAVTFAQLAIGVQAIAFGGLNWSMDDASAPVIAVNRLTPALGPAGALLPPRRGSTVPHRNRTGGGGVELRIRDLHFGYPRTDNPIYSGLDLDIRAGESLAVVGSNGAGKTTMAKLLCRFYDPTSGSISADGVELVDLDVESWRNRVTAVFQDVMRLEKSLRDNVDPGHRATDAEVLAALRDAGADHLAELDQPLAKGYPGGTDLSGGQWQRVALARALCAVRRQDGDGADLVLLDEPTANLDVRGESVIFERLLAATNGATRILISHRFSTVRMADRIAVLDGGKVTELGTHDELMAANGRYRRMFDLQASRFDASADEEGVDYERL
ncbi:MAG: ABC transporter ATP-binding protein/permease [Actinomycetota bacterium]|nr:ABC transporter ATP-binding protein/permease [Actinomycetota bacterium]